MDDQRVVDLESRRSLRWLSNNWWIMWKATSAAETVDLIWIRNRPILRSCMKSITSRRTTTLQTVCLSCADEVTTTQGSRRGKVYDKLQCFISIWRESAASDYIRFIIIQRQVRTGGPAWSLAIPKRTEEYTCWLAHPFRFMSIHHTY
jgi:hypothetical protein